MSLVMVGERCPSCTKFRSPLEMINHGGYRQCVYCEHRHEEALHSLSTRTPPKECSECGRTWEQLQEAGESRMACHMEDGRYRMMCLPCDRVYTPKRSELYAPTEFGRALGL